VELLVVIAIVAVLVAILLPALSRAKDAAKELQCASNLRVLGQAVSLYTTDWRGYYPPGLGYGPVGRGWQWPDALSPYVGRALPYAPRTAQEAKEQVYRCPVATPMPPSPAGGVWASATTSYVPNARVLTCIRMTMDWWPDLDLPHKLGKIRMASEQMMLSEGFIGQYGYTAYPPVPLDQIWKTREQVLRDGFRNGTAVIPWHAGYTRSNILMADFHVEMRVTARQGWERRYDNPTRRGQSPPWPQAAGLDASMGDLDY
jgi:prepilin-type processing-associated H-X9-DG protein